MKSLCLVTAITFLLLPPLFGEIKNGYSTEVQHVRETAQALNEMLLTNDSLTSAQKKKIKATLRLCDEFVLHHELTELLLLQFLVIAPDLYHEIDSLKDLTGKRTDIFVKFITMFQDNTTFPGTTSMGYLIGDPDISQSEYGANTVSIKVWIADNSLAILAHELGHVRFQVRNLAWYTAYYQQHYNPASFQSYLGHIPSDPSGQSARDYETRFSGVYRNFLSRTQAKRLSPVALRAQIKHSLERTPNPSPYEPESARARSTG